MISFHLPPGDGRSPPSSGSWVSSASSPRYVVRLARRVVAVGAEVVPRFDLRERSLRPRLDGIEEADEEVHRKGADVDLILSDRDPVEELLFDLSPEPKHLPSIVSDLMERGDDLFFGPDRSNEDTDHGLEIHGERGHRSGEPFTQRLPPLVGDRVHGAGPLPDVLLSPVEQAHYREALDLSVDGTFGSAPRVSEVADPLLHELVCRPGVHGKMGEYCVRSGGQLLGHIFLLTYSKREYSFTPI